MLLFTFPGALALTMPYTEGSFILWSIVALIALGDVERDAERWHSWSCSRPWWGTGLAGFAAFMPRGPRSTGIAVRAAVAWHAVIKLVRCRRAPWGHILIRTPGLLGVLVDLVYAGRRTGDPFIRQSAQAQWHQVLDCARGWRWRSRRRFRVTVRTTGHGL